MGGAAISLYAPHRFRSPSQGIYDLTNRGLSQTSRIQNLWCHRPDQVLAVVDHQQDMFARQPPAERRLSVLTLDRDARGARNRVGDQAPIP